MDMKVSRYSLPYPAENIYMRLWRADAWTFVWLRRLLVALGCTVGLLQLRLFVLSHFPPYLYMKDFIQEYLLARAVMSKVNPYLPLPVLVEKFIGPVTVPLMPHATPHPPPAILLGLPFAAFPYSWAAAIWGVLTLVCAGITVQLILIELTGKCPSVLSTIVVTLLWLGWQPFLYELIYGQFMILLGLLLILAWRFVRRGNHLLGGFFLGLVFALKLLAWPLILYFVFERQWRIVTVVLLTFFVANLGATLLTSYDTTWEYYGNLGSSVMPLYRSSPDNFSLWTISWRLFEGTGSPVRADLESPPVVFAPRVASWITYGALLSVLLATFKSVARVSNFDTVYGIFVGISIFMSPIAWIHYFSWLVFPISLLVLNLKALKFPLWETNMAVLGCTLLYLYPMLMKDVICALSGVEYVQGIRLQVSTAAGLLTYILPFSAMGMLALLYLVDRLGMKAR
ncbi:MAG: DUF2029 domain-containing protein [Anaerolineae bacterium]|nr:DUF2029 domain-containing protein [Anaerolineae bacterium]